MAAKNFKKLLFFLLFLGGVLGYLVYIFAYSATLYGEIYDNGGDPNLEVWFQWGRTSSYQYETPHQSITCSNPPCQFSATVSNLDACTTYHYRAVAKHRNFNDTRYGEDKILNTPCNVTVDLRANGSDGPIDLSWQNRTVTLSWTSQYADFCSASGDWSGIKSTSGSESITLDTVKTYYFSLTCRNNSTGFQSSDSVQVRLLPPNAPQVITKGAVVTL